MAANALTTSRRTMLGAFAAAPVAIALRASAAPAQHHFHDALAAWRVAEAKADAFGANVVEPTDAACDRAKAKVPHEIVPFPASTIAVVNGKSVLMPVAFSTEDEDKVAYFRRCQTDRRLAAMKYGADTEYQASAKRLVKAADRRDAKLAQIERRYRLSELEQQERDLYAEACGAFSRMMQVRAPDVSALALKMDLAFGRDPYVPLCEEYRAALLADARALA